jgi:hypothetical protein
MLRHSAPLLECEQNRQNVKNFVLVWIKIFTALTEAAYVKLYFCYLHLK